MKHLMLLILGLLVTGSAIYGIGWSLYNYSWEIFLGICFTILGCVGLWITVIFLMFSYLIGENTYEIFMGYRRKLNDSSGLLLSDEKKS